MPKVTLGFFIHFFLGNFTLSGAGVRCVDDSWHAEYDRFSNQGNEPQNRVGLKFSATLLFSVNRNFSSKNRLLRIYSRGYFLVESFHTV